MPFVFARFELQRREKMKEEHETAHNNLILMWFQRFQSIRPTNSYIERVSFHFDVSVHIFLMQPHKCALV